LRQEKRAKRPLSFNSERKRLSFSEHFAKVGAWTNNPGLFPFLLSMVNILNIIRPAARSLLCAGVCALAALSGTAQAQYQMGNSTSNGSSTDSTNLSRGSITIAPYNATFTPSANSGAAGDGSGGCSRVTNAGGCGGAGGASGGSGGAGSGSGSGGNG